MISTTRILRFPLVAIAALSSLMLASVEPVSGQEHLRIAVARFSHETCTFCPRPTGIAEWEFYGPPVRGEAVLGMGDYVGGFVDRAREYADVDFVGIYSPGSARGGSSGSWVTQAAFDKYTYGMVGDTPIFVTLDLHANEDHELSDAANAVFIVKRYPHYDARLQGERAARIMIRTIRGDYEPTMATRKPGVITPSVYQGTGVAPAMEIMERARRWESRVRDVFVSVAFGFAYADVPDVGATVMVVTNDDQVLADRIADDMSEYIWRVREEFAGKVLPKTREGVAQAIATADRGETPVVIADHSDRTGNSTHILEELVRQGARNFVIATIADERAIQEIQRSGGVGSRVSVDVGGYADDFAGNPVRIDGVVEFLGRMMQFETVAVVRFGEDNRVILTPALHQVTDTSIFPALGIDFGEVDIVSIKSRVHFWRGYVETGIAGAVVVIDAPGLGPADLSTIEYKNIPEGIYPLSGRR